MNGIATFHHFLENMVIVQFHKLVNMKPGDSAALKKTQHTLSAGKNVIKKHGIVMKEQVNGQNVPNHKNVPMTVLPVTKLLLLPNISVGINVTKLISLVM